ncbi:hypothetical protein A9995_15485 [Erythrobacter sp. QSSC1-22B]|uniref:glycosyltransferase n=1 Tax=Erythrobacter sp. QSSC1-22B TaxID=1860125 RepID=UPI0008060668|nr:glycosyltransferase [Erythrobacter sp. QSSC1-22B]OBX17598.1 hypothetical protein A9995_15485 [Erythrobacter sp. QSSC1-22B]
MKVLYLIERFPSYSQTFIIDEIKDHLIDNVDVQIVVLGSKELADFPVDDYGSEISRRTSYLGLANAKVSFSVVRAVFSGLVACLTVENPRILWRLRSKKDLSLREIFLGAVIASKCEHIDVIHCHFGHIGRLGLATGEHMDPKPALVVTFHAFEMLKEWSLPLGRFYAPLFDGTAVLLPISEYWRSLLLKSGASKESTFVHHMGVEIPASEGIRRLTQRLDVANLVMVGRMVEKKGHLIALDALAILREKYPELSFHCEMIGSGPLKNLIEDRSSKLGLCSYVDLVGPKPHAATLQAINASDLLLLPSVTAADGDKEGIPVVLMEAMAREIPVISTKHSGIPELIENGVSGLLVTERDPEELAEAIATLLLDGNRRQKLAEAGRGRVIEKFNRASLSRDLRIHYKNALETMSHRSTRAK